MDETGKCALSLSHLSEEEFKQLLAFCQRASSCCVLHEVNEHGHEYHLESGKEMRETLIVPAAEGKRYEHMKRIFQMMTLWCDTSVFLTVRFDGVEPSSTKKRLEKMAAKSGHEMFAMSGISWKLTRNAETGKPVLLRM